MFSKKTGPSLEKGSLKTLNNLVMTEKRRFAGLMALTVIHSSMFLLIPFALKEIQRLSNIELDERHETDLRISAQDNHQA
jgi:hypothetical protein